MSRKELNNALPSKIPRGEKSPKSSNKSTPFEKALNTIALLSALTILCALITLLISTVASDFGIIVFKTSMKISVVSAIVLILCTVTHAIMQTNDYRLSTLRQRLDSANKGFNRIHQFIVTTIFVISFLLAILGLIGSLTTTMGTKKIEGNVTKTIQIASVESDNVSKLVQIKTDDGKKVNLTLNDKIPSDVPKGTHVEGVYHANDNKSKIDGVLYEVITVDE